MNIVVLMVPGLGVAVLVEALFCSISRNIRQGEMARVRLAAPLHLLRLHRALGLFGIDLDAYLQLSAMPTPP
jgi:hypothetical protein